MKRLILIAIILGACATAYAQDKAGAVPAMKTEDQLRIRNLQYEQDKNLLEMKKLEARYRELQTEVTQAQQQIEEAVRAAAKAISVDLNKFQFDLDTLRFLPRPQIKPPEAPK